MRDMSRSGSTSHGDLFRFSRPPILPILWYLLAIFSAYDLVQRGEGRTIWIGLSAIALITVVVYATGQRPAVFATPTGVLLRNVVRDVWLPWHLVERIDSTWSLVIRTADRGYGSWAVTGASSSRQRGPRGGDPVAGLARGSSMTGGRSGGASSPAQDEPWTVPSRLEQLRRRGMDGERSGEVDVRPAWPVISALVVTAVALAVSLAVPAG